jgi:hypothetical protein
VHRFWDLPRIDQFITTGFKSLDQIVAVIEEAREAIPDAILNGGHGRRRVRESGAGTPVSETAFDPGRTIGNSRTRPRMANKGGTRLSRLIRREP